jgi:hypothetical protein
VNRRSNATAREASDPQSTFIIVPLENLRSCTEIEKTGCDADFHAATMPDELIHENASRNMSSAEASCPDVTVMAEGYSHCEGGRPEADNKMPVARDEAALCGREIHLKQLVLGINAVSLPDMPEPLLVASGLNWTMPLAPSERGELSSGWDPRFSAVLVADPFQLKSCTTGCRAQARFLGAEMEPTSARVSPLW